MTTRQKPANTRKPRTAKKALRDLVPKDTRQVRGGDTSGAPAGKINYSTFTINKTY